MIASLGFRAKVRPHQYKKARHAIRNVSKKDLSKIIKEFDKLPHQSYEKKRPKYEPTDRYFYLARQIAKCMMRADAINSHVYPVRTEMTAPSLHVCSTDKDESKGIIMHKNLSQNVSTDEDKSKHSIVNEFLLQNCSMDKYDLGYMEEDRLECTITEQNNANNEVTYDVPNYFNVSNVIECRRKILERIDVSYERSYMATPKEEYFTEMMEHLNEYIEPQGQRLSIKNLEDDVIRVM